ncbi:Ig-like domain-containing protein [Anaeromassilibacillus senegalensis]|uniref:Ig-like domain-containing protein n=1 Tax=Anaeromassilibacillus senegalensis TaxID=1673717 RepID=UPI000681F570|nr:Ig-like domain-containing protein [Anaeromassilibacillus senegalensis]
MAIQTVKAVINGQEHNLTYNSSSGKWEATLTAPGKSSYNQSGHYYGVAVTATDNAGNTGTASASTSGAVGEALRLVVREKVKPTISITSPGAGALLTDSTPTITAQLRDDDSGIDISTLALKIDSGATAGSTATGMTVTQVTGGYDIIYTPQTTLADGAHTITINVSDHDGNAATAATRSITIDTTPPTLDVTSPQDNYATNRTALTVSGTTNDATSGPVTIRVTLNGTDQGAVTVNSSGAWTKAVTLREGVNTIVVTATDRAEKTTTITRTVTLNTTAPVISAVTITPNPVDAGKTFIISVTVK